MRDTKYKIRVTSDERRATKKGLTLVETTVVITVVAVLTSLSMPAIRTFFSSMASQGNTRALVSAALSSARAIAAKEQRYAGIRFQKAYNPQGPLNAPQYMIFIIHDQPNTGLSNGFRAAQGIQPIKLPETIGVMDLMVRTHTDPTPGAAKNPESSPIMINNLDNEVGIRDTSSFSVVFSPSGKMVIHDVRVRNRNGIYQPDNSGPNVSMDDIFNSTVNIEPPYHMGMFVQDDYANLGLGAESSRNSFVIYDKARFDRMDKNERYDYLMNLMNLDAIYINPYTGTIID